MIDFNLLSEKDQIKKFINLIQVKKFKWKQTHLKNNKKEFDKLLLSLIVTHKGLTLVELANISNLPISKIEQILSYFSKFCSFYNNLYNIINIPFQKYFEKKDLKEIRLDIAKEVQKSLFNIRTVEEVSVAMFLSKEYFSLKQYLCQIENFLLLNNEHTKLLLHQFWKILEQKGYDIVQEYNKSIEIFEVRFMLPDKQIFLINLQICCFLKGEFK